MAPIHPGNLGSAGDLHPPELEEEILRFPGLSPEIMSEDYEEILKDLKKTVSIFLG